MRNESDIFCLKELKDGEVDGTQMFSVSGQCPLKISRRRNQHTASGTFEYGSIPPTGGVDEPDRREEEGAGPSDDDEAANPATEDAGDCARQAPKQKPQKKSPQTRKPAKQVEVVTESAMSRNPLTGAGMEIAEHRKPKKGAKQHDKWVW